VNARTRKGGEAGREKHRLRGSQGKKRGGFSDLGHKALWRRPSKRMEPNKVHELHSGRKPLHGQERDSNNNREGPATSKPGRQNYNLGVPEIGRK